MSLSASEKAARRTRRRIWLVAGGFAAVMAAATVRLGMFASVGVEARPINYGAIETASMRIERAEIVDRRGAPLAGAAPTYTLYLDRDFLALPEERAEAAALLGELFADDAARVTALLEEKEADGDLADGTITVRFRATPLEAQRALDLGIAGLYRAERMDRVYFGGRATAHVLGYVNIDGVGLAGVEGAMDAELRAPGAGPLRLSVDLRVQRRVWAILSAAKERMGALAAAAVVMRVDNGEIVAMVSLPDFDPHRIDERFAQGSSDPRFHWAISTDYEPGSVMKIATWALALEHEIADMTTIIDAPPSFRAGGVTIRDATPSGRISLPMAFARSSNVVAATLALRAGPDRQRAFYDSLGLMEPSGVEVLEARRARPGWHRVWRESTTATVAFGHGVQLSSVQLAEMTATLVGGGERVRATLIAGRPQPVFRERVVSEETSASIRTLLALNVARGTGVNGAVAGLDVGGKTGTSEKVINGVYADGRNVANFIAAFPMRDPEYVVVVMLDEPVGRLPDGRPTRFASWTAAPTTAEIIEAIAPLLGVAPAPAAQ